MAEKIKPMHQPQGATDLAFARQDLTKNFAGLGGVAKRMSDQTDLATEKIGQFRCRFELSSLGDLDHPHHLGRVFSEDVAAPDVDLSILNEKGSDAFGRSPCSRKKGKKR